MTTTARQDPGRPPLTREAIIATAIGIADSDGLDAVSIRRIAAELDARPMSLYDHIESKEALLTLMADEVVGEVIVDGPLPEHWRDAMALIARLLYATFVGHPWMVIVLGSSLDFGANGKRQAAQLADAMSGLALDPAEMWVLCGTVNDYVLGHSYRASMIAPPDQLEDVIAEDAIAEIPELASLPSYLQTRATIDRFEAGLKLVLDGIEQRIRDVAG